MPLDASYDQLMRLLSARGIEWFRRHVEDLPDPLPADDAATVALAQAGRIAPVLSGLRGHPSPLADLVGRRLSATLVRSSALRLLTGDATDGMTCDGAAGLVLAGRAAAADEPLAALALSALADDPAAALTDRIAARVRPDAGLLAEAEGQIDRALRHLDLDRARIGDLAWLVMHVYAFGAIRPHFSRPRLYGDVFAAMLRASDWACRAGCVTSMAQTAFCLRLIDPDHDIAPILADIIASQRPDGSFPARAGVSSRDQDLGAGTWPTLMVLAALSIAVWRRWRGSAPDLPCDRPLSACRDHAAALLAPRIDAWAARATPAGRLQMAASMSSATSENWFQRLGMQRNAPGPAPLVVLARQLFGDAYAARHARRTLDLARHWPRDREAGEDGAALRWLRGAPVALDCAALGSAPATGGAAADLDAGFRLAVADPAGALSRDWRLAARRDAGLALSALQSGARLSPGAALAHLDRLCLIARLAEGDLAIAAAA
ncbi:hypothetical protein [Paracoccus spongiarum]|uniref:Uncharacterized protein n=1 Tax=Paracoccus spongiarum TaxID=3064387 RepID=A0ABT9JDS2_9RHOB|nr:hypothetical protein [Paracoccus sp. 2205BS29-5]MDP5307865.1 hypothetical protein [Paracoccus sp. 2205BS29-5]